ncbi:MAG: Uma2 family endonuclease [Acidobacteriia bacterium]|nr:Uma2 family endonuclease [Terriglobia bacterium]
MSGAAFDQLPYEEGSSLELLQGELIEVSSPTPRHQRIVNKLIVSLGEYFRGETRGETLQDSEFALGEADRLRPDLAILLAEHSASVDENENKTPIPFAPDIAVEVISPSERATDTMGKVWIYLDAGTQEVWQFQPASEKVLVYRGLKSIIALGVGESLSTPLLPGLEIPVRDIFRTKRQR